MGRCVIVWKETGWLPFDSTCPDIEGTMISDFLKGQCTQVDEATCAADALAKNYEAFARCRFNSSMFRTFLSALLNVTWVPCGNCCYDFSNSCELGNGCVRALFTSSGTFPDCGEDNFSSCVGKHRAGDCNPNACCPHAGASYVGCYNSQSTNCCTQAGDLPLAQKCSLYTNDPCVKGCCCPTGCENVSVFESCPLGCTSKPGGLACVSVDDPACTGGCCLCDRCCDMPASDCITKGGSVMSGSCSVAATQTSCKNANVKPACEGGIWKLGIRPTQHTAKPGRMSIVSALTHKNKDLASGQTECRKIYGWLQKSATTGAMEGRICNQYNQRCVSTKKSPIMKLVRNATSGVMQWEGKYRTPCPEQADFVSTCSTIVGCTA